MNLFLKNSILTLFIILMVGCKKPTSDINKIESKGYTVEYANGFSVVKTPEYTEVIVHNPWDKSKILEKYILVDKANKLPANLPKGTLIRTPLSNVVAYSTVHCSSLAELEALDAVKGVCDPQFINLPQIKEKITSNTITDVGESQSPNIEKIILLKPEAIFIAPVSGTPFGAIEKIRIPIIQTPDYMENSALGRAEWVRFYSLFVGKEALADSLFAITKEKYLEITNRVGKKQNRPVVLTDSKYGNVWYVGGGKSFIANMYRDAGGLSPWYENEDTGSLSLSFEAVLDKAENADIWLIKYNSPTDITYQSLEREFKGYSYFKAFKQKNVYGCNMSKVLYYEDLPIHPDYILEDMAAIFHPELFSNYKLRYYTKLQ